MHDMTTVTITD